MSETNDGPGEPSSTLPRTAPRSSYLRVEGGSVWFHPAGTRELFQTTKQNISLHIRNILAEGELSEAATVKEYLTVSEGSCQIKRPLQFYNLDLILAVGYRVRSPRGTQFRQWATQHLREYLIKGFVLDDERLKNPGAWITSMSCCSASGRFAPRKSASPEKIREPLRPWRPIIATTPQPPACSSPTAQK